MKHFKLTLFDSDGVVLERWVLDGDWLHTDEPAFMSRVAALNLGYEIRNEVNKAIDPNMEPPL